MHSILEVIRLKQRRRRLGQNLLQLFKFFFIFQHVVLTEAHANVPPSKQSTQISLKKSEQQNAKYNKMKAAAKNGQSFTNN